MVCRRGPYGERDTVSRASGSFVHSFIRISSVKELSHEIRGKHVTVHGAPRGRRTAYNGMRPGSPVNRIQHCFCCPSAMQGSARYLPPWLGSTRAQLARVCRSNPPQGVPSTPVTATHVNQGTELHVTPRYGRWVGFMGGVCESNTFLIVCYLCIFSFLVSYLCISVYSFRR
jgi:hypothetical protein